MRTLRLSLAGTVIIVLLGGLGGTVIGQEDEPWTADWLTPTEEHVFSSTGCQLDKSQREAEYGPGGGKEIRGLRWTCEVTFSDPRLSGTQTTVFNEHCFVEGGCVNWGTMEIVGADGTWRGWFTGTEDPQGKTDLYITQTGAGAYEGLTSTRLASGQFWQPLTQIGVIYQGDPPPMLKPFTE